MPSTYIREYNKEIIEDLKGHLIPPDEFMADDFDGFIKKRKELFVVHSARCSILVMLYRKP
jgi:hypothetical protein